MARTIHVGMNCPNCVLELSRGSNRLGKSMPSKPSIPRPCASTEALREALRAREELTAKLRDQEPDWSVLTRRLCLDSEAEARLVAELQRVWLLPFIHVEAAVDLLVFQYSRLPSLRAEFQRNGDIRGQRLTHLFNLLLGMALQASSVFPQNPLHLARLAQQSLETGSIDDDRLEPLLELLVQSDGAGLREGKNTFHLTDANVVVISEYERALGIAEPVWKAPNKFEEYRQELLQSAEFQNDWATLRQRFPLDRLRDGAGIVRRSPLPERYWQPPTYPDLRTTRDQFQVCFDVFCWKWFLYGMRHDEPLTDKLSVTFTPFGTQIFIPGYWSLDPTRDLDWSRILKLHRARSVPKQGVKLSTGRLHRQREFARLLEAEKTAKKQGLRGPERYAFLRKSAGLPEQTDDRQVRRLLKEASVRNKKAPPIGRRDPK